MEFADGKGSHFPAVASASTLMSAATLVAMDLFDWHSTTIKLFNRL